MCPKITEIKGERTRETVKVSLEMEKKDKRQRRKPRYWQTHRQWRQKPGIEIPPGHRVKAKCVSLKGSVKQHSLSPLLSLSFPLSRWHNSMLRPSFSSYFLSVFCGLLLDTMDTLLWAIAGLHAIYDGKVSGFLWSREKWRIGC